MAYYRRYYRRRGGKGKKLTPNQKAAVKFAKKFPKSKYGWVPMKRGGPDSLAQFGKDYGSATEDQKKHRTDYYFTGQGAYSLGKLWRNVVGRQGGRQIRDALIQRGMQGMSGQGLYTGSGAYISNNLIDGDDTNLVPSMQEIGDETGSVIISFREYIGDIYAPGTAGSGTATPFAIQSFALNPGIQATFNWLSQIASNYEEYEFIQLIFEYRSTTTDIGNSTTGQCGTIVMATNYNAGADTFTDKQTMLDYAHAHDCKVTENMSHGVECAPNKTAISTQLYVRSGPAPSGSDIKTYDKGKFQVAICNCPPAYNGLPIGELRVYYTVKLSKPKLATSRGTEIDRDLFYTNHSTGTSPTGATPFGAAGAKIYVGQQNNIGSQLVSNGASGGTLTLPANYTGNLALKIYCSTNNQNVAGAALNAPSIALGTNAQIVGIFDMWDVDGTPTSGYSSNPVAVGTQGDTYTEYHFFVTASTNGYNNSIIITGSVGCTSNVFTSVEVVQYNAYGLTKSSQQLQCVDPTTGQTYSVSAI